MGVSVRTGILAIVESGVAVAVSILVRIKVGDGSLVGDSVTADKSVNDGNGVFIRAIGVGSPVLYHQSPKRLIAPTEPAPIINKSSNPHPSPPTNCQFNKREVAESTAEEISPLSILNPFN